MMMNQLPPEIINIIGEYLAHDNGRDRGAEHLVRLSRTDTYLHWAVTGSRACRPAWIMLMRKYLVKPVVGRQSVHDTTRFSHCDKTSCHAIKHYYPSSLLRIDPPWFDMQKTTTTTLIRRIGKHHNTKVMMVRRNLHKRRDAHEKNCEKLKKRPWLYDAVTAFLAKETQFVEQSLKRRELRKLYLDYDHDD